MMCFLEPHCHRNQQRKGWLAHRETQPRHLPVALRLHATGNTHEGISPLSLRLFVEGGVDQQVDG